MSIAAISCISYRQMVEMTVSVNADSNYHQGLDAPVFLRYYLNLVSIIGVK